MGVSGTFSVPPSGPLARVKATTVRVRDHYVLARFGKTARERYREACSAQLLETLLTPGDRWVDFGQFIEATELCCRLFAEGDLTMSRDIGRFAAETNMGVWRSLVYRVLSPATVLSIAAGLWSHHYEGGRLVASPNGARGVRIRIEDFPTPHRTHCLSVEGWARRTVELGRPQRVSVVETACRLRGGDACELVGEWE
jgi:hypothetical protein